MTVFLFCSLMLFLNMTELLTLLPWSLAIVNFTIYFFYSLLSNAFQMFFLWFLWYGICFVHWLLFLLCSTVSVCKMRWKSCLLVFFLGRQAGWLMCSLYIVYIITVFNFCILGALSGARESWEYDSGARDLQSPDLQSHFTLQKILENGGSTVTKQAALQKLLAQASNYSNSFGGNYFELANTVSIFFLSSPIDYFFLLFSEEAY